MPLEHKEKNTGRLKPSQISLTLFYIFSFFFIHFVKKKGKEKLDENYVLVTDLYRKVRLMNVVVMVFIFDSSSWDFI